MAQIGGETVAVTGKMTMDTSETQKALQNVEQDIERVGDKGEKAGKKVAKGFGAANDIFGGLLPRNVQGMIRKFKSTQRAVTRAGKSFKFLKGAIAATGIGLLVIALTELIRNWESVSDWLGITSEETRKLKEENDKLQRSLHETTLAMDPYLEVIKDTTRAIEDREAALSNLGRMVQQVTGIDLEAADAIERIVAATDAHLRQQEEEIRLKNITEKIREKEQEMNNLDLKWYNAGVDEGTKLYLLEKKRREMMPELNALREERTGIVERQLEAQRQLNDEMERQREEAEAERKRLADEAAAEREAEAARKRRQKEREDQRKRDAASVARATKQAEQAGMTAEELALDELDRKEREELATAKSEEAKAAIREYYGNLYVQTIEKFQAEANKINDKNREDAEKREADEEKQRQDRLQEQLRNQQELEEELYQQSQTDRDQQRDRLATEFDERMLIADGNHELEKEIKAQYLQELADLEQRFRDEDLANEQQLQEQKVAAIQAGLSQVGNLMGDVSRLMGEGTKQAKDLAVVEVMINQGIAMANAIAGATKAASATGPGAPFVLAGYIASMIGTVIGGFKQIEAIMDTPMPRSGGGSGVGGGGGRTPQALIPNMDLDPAANAQQTMNVSAYVVQSQLQGQNDAYQRQLARATL